MQRLEFNWMGFRLDCLELVQILVGLDSNLVIGLDWNGIRD